MGNGALLDAIDALEPTPHEHAIIEKLGCMDRLFASVVADLDQFDRDGMWAVCGAHSMRGWLTDACKRSTGDAGRLLSTMRLLRSLPETAEAFGSGVLSKGHVDAIKANVTAGTVALFAGNNSPRPVSVAEPPATAPRNTA